MMKTYLNAGYLYRMTKNLMRWVENGAADKGDLEEDSYKIMKQFYLKRKDLLYLNKDGIVACKRKEEDNALYKYNSIVLPQLYQTKLLFRSHHQRGHQGVDKVVTGYRSLACKRLVENFLHACHVSKQRTPGS